MVLFDEELHKKCAALGDPTRRAILERLSATPLAVTDLAASMPVSRSAVSQHLKLLKDAGLVRESKSGRFSIYETDPIGLKELLGYVKSLSGDHPSVEPTAPPRHDRNEIDNAAEQQDQIDQVLDRWPEVWPQQNRIVTGLSARLMFTARLMDNALEKTAARRNLRGVELMILGTLKRLGAPFESTPTNLAKASLLSPPGISKRLDRLERCGWIERHPGSQDRRSVDVRLTEAGHEVIDYLIQQHTTDYLTVFELPPEEQKALNNMLRKILMRIESRIRTNS